MRTGRIRLRLVAVLALTACAPMPPVVESHETEALHAAAELEPAFRSFISTPLRGAGPAQSLDNLEQQIGELVLLRNRYLERLLRYSGTRNGLLMMLRIAEMHLDLAARARALSPPRDGSADNQVAFYEIVEVYAVPLEDAGLSVLQHVDNIGTSLDPSSAWVARARLYLALHAGDSHPRHRRDLARLRAACRRELRFSPPASLLDRGRLAPRAARLISD